MSEAAEKKMKWWTQSCGAKEKQCFAVRTLVAANFQGRSMRDPSPLGSGVALLVSMSEPPKMSVTWKRTENDIKQPEL